jgi:hypothetical protein
MNTILSLASVLAPAAAVALVAGGVCPPEQCRSHTPSLAPAVHLASLPLASVQQQTQIHTHIKVVQQDDTGTYELVIENGEPRAKVNGEAVPAERVIEREDGVWTIEDDGGGVVATFHIGAPPRAPRPPTANLSQDLPRPSLPQILTLAPSERDALRAPVNVEQPRTMLGVVMGPAPDGAADGGDGGVLIERVVEGLPADRAGLESGDVITRIDGADQATPDSLRTLLRDRKPGDKLQLRVLRGDEEKDLTVELEAFDRSTLAQTYSLAMELPQPLRGGAFAGSLGGLSGEARKQMDEAFKALREAEQLASGDAKRAHEHAREAIEQFVAALERMEAEGLSTGDAMRGDLGRWFGQFKDGQMVWGDKPGMIFTLPPSNLQFDRRGQRDQNSTGGNDETGSERIRKEDDVEVRLNAMADRLERIEKLLEKLAADGPSNGPDGDPDQEQ